MGGRGARTRADACIEHAVVEKDEVRYLSNSKLNLNLKAQLREITAKLGRVLRIPGNIVLSHEQSDSLINTFDSNAAVVFGSEGDELAVLVCLISGFITLNR